MDYSQELSNPEYQWDNMQMEELMAERIDLNENYNREVYIIDAQTGDTLFMGRDPNRIIRLRNAGIDYQTGNFLAEEEVEEDRHGGARLIKTYGVAYSQELNRFSYR